jgi:hypothetical protein
VSYLLIRRQLAGRGAGRVRPVRDEIVGAGARTGRAPGRREDSGEERQGREEYWELAHAAVSPR